MSEKLSIVDAINRFSLKGWMPGFSGAMAIIQNISEESQKIYVTCDKPQKGYIESNDIYVLRNLYGEYDIIDPLNKNDGPLEISRWSNIFIEIFGRFPSIKCVLQLCPKWPVLAANAAMILWKKKSESHPNLLRISHFNLLEKLNSKNELLLPIVNYDTSEKMLASIKEKLDFFLNTPAIIIRNYGIFIWGDSIIDAENKMGLLDHLCELQFHNFKLHLT